MATNETDDLLPFAEAWLRTMKDGSLMDLQRHFRIGYNRSAWLLETMTSRGTAERYDDGMTVRMRLPRPTRAPTDG